MRSVRLLDEADREMRMQALFYELKRPGLGLRFLDRVQRTADSLRRYPHAGAPIRRSPFRKANVQGWPFRLVYALTPKHIWIVAVAHHRRRFRYWRDRDVPETED